MPYKNLLVHIDEIKANASRLQVAIDLARAHKAHLTGLYVVAEPELPGFVASQLPREVIEEKRARSEETAQAAIRVFVAEAERQAVAADTRIGHARDPEVAALIARHARYFDLVVVGQADPDEPSPGGRHMVEDLVLSSGRPVLVVPYIGRFETIGKRVMVAWNGQREAARAVHDAMPLFEQAETVMVYSVDPADKRHFAGADICAYLARHGVRAEASHIVLGPEAEAVSPVLQTVGGFGFRERGAWTRSRHAALAETDVGNALLSAVTDSSIDLLVMGAYGHSRIRELVLGGATREILSSMTVPVLMSN